MSLCAFLDVGTVDVVLGFRAVFGLALAFDALGCVARGYRSVCRLRRGLRDVGGALKGKAAWTEGGILVVVARVGMVSVRRGMVRDGIRIHAGDGTSIGADGMMGMGWIVLGWYVRGVMRGWIVWVHTGRQRRQTVLHSAGRSGMLGRTCWLLVGGVCGWCGTCGLVSGRATATRVGIGRRTLPFRGRGRRGW